MDAGILQPDVGKRSENGSQAGERIVARWQAVSLRTGRRLPEHRLNPVL
jgi:hypothetical protein